MGNDFSRRQLLYSAGAATLAAPFGQGGPQSGPKPEETPPLPPDQRLGWVICGIGNFATNQIIPSFGECRRSKLAGFVTGDVAKGRRFAEQYGVDPRNVWGYDQMDRLREARGVDVVYVITPNALHGRHAIAAARAGKHVFCEKPMAPTVKECEEMIAASRQAGKRLGIAYRAQYEPYNLKAIELCRSGKLGKLTSIIADHGRILDPSKPEDRW
jgi:predicted dehydrogenase